MTSKATTLQENQRRNKQASTHDTQRQRAEVDSFSLSRITNAEKVLINTLLVSPSFAQSCPKDPRYLPSCRLTPTTLFAVVRKRPSREVASVYPLPNLLATL